MDQHGQLFLSNTKIRNFVTCYKDPAFLDFFYTRLKPLEPSSTDAGIPDLARQGYSFISLCGKERNYVRCQDTPIVFKRLYEDEDAWKLGWAGSFAWKFSPESLKVDKRGYLYHPSPQAARSARKRSKDAQTGSTYGAYSLLKSELVLSQLSTGLTVDEQSQTGSFEWQGERFSIGRLHEQEVFRGNGYPED